MNGRHETGADIVAEMRREVLGDDGVFFTMDGRRVMEFADRIEAAAKREELRWAKANGELARLLDLKKAQGGNVAKLREALEKSHNFLGMLIREDVLPGTLPPEASDLADDAWDALHAPPRNCDRFDDDDDAFAAWHDSLVDGDVVGVRNGFRWLFAPATQEGGEQWS